MNLDKPPEEARQNHNQYFQSNLSSGENNTCKVTETKKEIIQKRCTGIGGLNDFWYRGARRHTAPEN